MDLLKAYFSISGYHYADWLNGDTVVSLRDAPQGRAILRHNVNTGEITSLFETQEGIRDLHLARNGDIFFSLDTAGTENPQIHRLKDGKGEAIPLTFDKATAFQIGGLSSDGRSLLVSSNGRDKRSFDIIGIDIESGKSQILIQNEDHYNIPAALSKNGRYLLVNKLRGGGDNPLWLIDVEERTAIAAPEIDRKASYSSPVWKQDHSGFYCVSDDGSDFPYVGWYSMEDQTFTPKYLFDWGVDNIALSQNDRYLAINVNEEGYSSLYVVDLVEDVRMNIPATPKGVISEYLPFHWAPDSNRLLFTLAGSTQASSLWMLDLEKDAFICFDTPDMAGLTSSDFVEPELLHFKSFDGLEVPYFLYRPKGLEGSMALMLDIHGGPEGQARPGIAYKELLHYMVASGIAVVEPNVRGSSGYGKKYEHLDDVEKRLDSVKDVRSLVEDLVERGIADPKRIGVMGVSYGGFMTLSAAARMPELFCCAVCTVGMFNLVTFLENTANYRRAHREEEYGSLKKHRNILYEVSPVAMVDNITGPLMIIHGKNDPRVPVSEAYQAKEYLNARGVEVELLVYDDEGHGLSKLKNKLDCYPQVMRFIEQHMAIR